MIRLLVLFAASVTLTGFSQAQPPAAAKAPASGSLTPVERFAPPKGKKSPLDTVKDYKRLVIEGFTVMVHNEVLDVDAAKYERHPLEALEWEFQTLLKNLTPKTADLFRKLVIWIEWDAKVQMTNGRLGYPVAVYYGGDQLSMLRDGENPLKSKTITILSLKSLTEEHQPKQDSGRCVIMHEFAHVVHDQILGRDNFALKSAFQQAMQRRLYDRDAYVSTNESEFFAELTCAYFENATAFPRTREELKKHDPVSFQLIDSIWGLPKKSSTIPPKTTAKGPGPNGSGKFDLEVKVTDLTLGDAVIGEAVTQDQLKNKVKLFACWGKGDSPLLEKLSQAMAEVEPFGGAVVVVRGPGEEADKAQKVIDAGPAEFPVIAVLGIKEKAAPQPVALPASQAILFGADGTCLYRGSAFDAIPHLRAAVGKKLIADLGKMETSKGFTNAAAALTSGEPLLSAIPKVAALTASQDKETISEAKMILAALLAPGLDALSKAQSEAKSDPAGSFILAEKVAATYKGTSVGTKATALVGTLKSNPAVGKELKARQMLDQVRKFENYFATRPWAFDPISSEFQRQNELQLLQLKAVIEAMRKQYPDAKATAEATRIGKGFAIEAQ